MHDPYYPFIDMSITVQMCNRTKLTKPFVAQNRMAERTVSKLEQCVTDDINR
jgi:hypothetical protein